jgi:hypothetical protein
LPECEILLNSVIKVDLDDKDLEDYNSTDFEDDDLPF